MVLANIVALNSLKASLVMTGPHLRPCQHFICGACGIRSDCMVMLQTTFCCQFTNAAQSDVTASRFSVPSVFTTYIVVQNWDRSCALCSLWLILHFFFPLDSREMTGEGTISELSVIRRWLLSFFCSRTIAFRSSLSSFFFLFFFYFTKFRTHHVLFAVTPFIICWPATVRLLCKRCTFVCGSSKLLCFSLF